MYDGDIESFFEKIPEKKLFILLFSFLFFIFIPPFPLLI